MNFSVFYPSLMLSDDIFEQVELALEQIEPIVVDLLELLVEKFPEAPFLQFFIAESSRGLEQCKKSIFMEIVVQFCIDLSFGFFNFQN